MNKYTQLKEKHSKEIRSFPMFFAFNDEQLDKGLKELNATEDELIAVGCGGIIRKEDMQKYLELIKRHYDEDKEAMKDDDYVYQMFRYELANHEFCITYDYTDTLEALGLKLDKLDNRMLKLLHKAQTDYLKEVEDE